MSLRSFGRARAEAGIFDVGLVVGCVEIRSFGFLVLLPSSITDYRGPWNLEPIHFLGTQG